MREPYIGRPVVRIRVDMSQRLPVDDALLDHLDHLVGIGMNPYMIARTAGVTATTVRNLHEGIAAACTTSIRSALIGVTPRPSKHQAHVLSYATVRRLDGLAVMGWSTGMIAEKLDVDRAWFTSVVRRSKLVSWNRHAAVAELYSNLAMRDGGNARTKEWAKRRGFLPPLAWDDVDDFYETPSVPERMDAQQYRLEEVDFLRRMGLSDRDIAAKLGIALFSLQQWERRYREVAA